MNMTPSVLPQSSPKNETQKALNLPTEALLETEAENLLTENQIPEISEEEVAEMLLPQDEALPVEHSDELEMVPNPNTQTEAIEPEIILSEQKNNQTIDIDKEQTIEAPILKAELPKIEPIKQEVKTEIQSEIKNELKTEIKTELPKTVILPREALSASVNENKNTPPTELAEQVKKEKSEEKEPEELKEKPKEKDSLSRVTNEPQPLTQTENKNTEIIKAEKNTEIENKSASEEKIATEVIELPKVLEPELPKDIFLNRPVISLFPIGQNNVLSAKAMEQEIKISGTIHHLDDDVVEKFLFITINEQDYLPEWQSETEFELMVPAELLKDTSAFSAQLTIKDKAGNEQSTEEILNYVIDVAIQQPQWKIQPITADNILSSEELKEEITIQGEIIYPEKDIVREKSRIQIGIQEEWIEANLNPETNIFSAVISGEDLAKQNEIQIKSELIDQAGNQLNSEIYRHAYQFKANGSIQVDDFTKKIINQTDLENHQTFTLQGHYKISQGAPKIQLTVGDLTVLAKAENGHWSYDFSAWDLAVLNTENAHQKISVQLYDSEMNLTDSKELFYQYDTQIHVPQFSFDVMTLDNHLDIDEAQQYYTPIKGKFTQLGNDISVEHILFKMGQYQIENIQVNEQDKTFITFVPTELLMNHQELTGYFTVKDDAGNMETVELKHEYTTEKHDLNGNDEDNLFLVYHSEALFDGQEGIDKVISVGQDLSLKSSQFQNIEYIDLFGTNNHLLLDQIQNDLTIRGQANNQVQIESALWENLEKIDENLYSYQINNQTFKLNIQSDIQII